MFEKWNAGDVADRLWKRLVNNAETDTIYELDARLRLASRLYLRKKYQKALQHIEHVREQVQPHRGIIVPREAFFRFYMNVRYRAAGQKPDVLESYVMQGTLAERRGAIRLLGRVGNRRHVRMLREGKSSAPPVLHPVIEEAVALILARRLQNSSERPFNSVEELRKRLAEMGEVRWVRKDPHKEDMQWAAVKKHFLISCDLQKGGLNRHRENARWLTGDVPEVRHIVFTTKRVWVGTDHGLFAYRRASAEWNLFAVGGERIHCEITGIAKTTKGLQVTVDTKNSGRELWLFNVGRGEWRKIDAERRQ